MNLQQLAELPTFRRSAELQQQYVHIHQAQARFSAAIGQLADIQLRYAHIQPHRRNLAYYERLGELIRWGVEVDNEIREKVEEVEPVLHEVNPALIERYRVNVLPVVREFVIWAYRHTDVSELRYMLPDEIVKDLIRFAKGRKVDFDRLADEVDNLTETVETPPGSSPTGQPSTPAKNKGKIPLRGLALAIYYLDISGERPAPETRKEIEQIAVYEGYKSGGKYYEYTLEVQRSKERHSNKFQQYRDFVSDYLAPYPKALQKFENEIVSK